MRGAVHVIDVMRRACVTKKWLKNGQPNKKAERLAALCLSSR
jgi:hypothetical protein